MARIRRFIHHIVGHSAKEKIFFFSSLLVVVLLCILVIRNVWIQSQNDTRDEALKLASVAGAGIAKENLIKLDLNQSDLEKPGYLETKESLQNIRAAHRDIRFAYILMERNGRVYLAADSEPTYSKDYSPPGQEFTEATPQTYDAFQKGKPIFDSSTDRWGTWVSVLVPIKNDETGKVLGLFGVDYTVKIWYWHSLAYTEQAAIASVCLFLLYLALLAVFRTNRSIRREIVERTKTEKELQERERSYAVLLSNLPGMAYRCKYDRDWTMLFVSDGCLDLTGYYPSGLLHNKEIAFNDLIGAKYQDDLWAKWEQVVKNRAKLAEEYEIITASGETKWVFEQGQAIYDEAGNVEALEGLIIDITDRKQKEDEIVYLNYHDFLTGIYNRRFLEQAKEQLDREECLPLSVIMGDINGLKMVNDVFGHADGDILIRETARIIQSCCRESDIFARTGGDEFTILLPRTGAESAEAVTEAIRRSCEEYNRTLSEAMYSLNIALGISTKKSAEESLDGAIKAAEDSMYRRKLLEHKSLHTIIHSSVKATARGRSREIPEHGGPREIPEHGERLKNRETGGGEKPSELS